MKIERLGKMIESGIGVVNPLSIFFPNLLKTWSLPNYDLNFHFFVSPSKKFQAQITTTIAIMIRMTPCKEITLKGNIVSIFRYLKIYLVSKIAHIHSQNKQNEKQNLLKLRMNISFNWCYFSSFLENNTQTNIANNIRPRMMK